MSGAKHTPGPWVMHCEDREPGHRRGKDDDGLRFWGIYPPSSTEFRGMIATVHDAEHIGGISVAERNANAHLLWAAPDMLEALIACRDQFNLYAREHRKAEKHEKAATNERFAFLASQAIAKATGAA